MTVARALTLLGSLLLLAGCQATATTTAPVAERPEPWHEPPRRPSYVGGEVIVGFRDGVTEPQADALFISHALRWESNFSKLFSYWVEVESGDPNAFAARLSESPIVMWAKRRGNPAGRAGVVYILVMFNNRATDSSAQDLIDSIPQLRVGSRNYPPQWGIAFVEPGKEFHWIEILESASIVKYATVNGIGGFY